MALTECHLLANGGAYHRHVSGRKGDVDDLLRQPRTGELQRPVHKEQRHRSRDQPSVRPDVAHEPPHETGVIRLAEGFVFVTS